MREFASEFYVEEASVRFYGFRIQTRMAVVRLPARRLFLYSPLSPTRRLREELSQLGDVTWLVSPNKIHNLTLAAWRAAYPRARLLVPPGLPERVPGLAYDDLLTEAAVPDWSPALQHVLSRGNCFFSEAMFFHPASATLLVGDFVERIDASVASPAARAAARLFGAPSRPAASPEHRLYATDVETLAESVAAVLRWPFERIFLCHGPLVETGGRQVFAEVAGSLLRDVNRRGALARRLFAWLARLQ